MALRSWPLRLAGACLLVALCCFTHAGLLHAKAILAQWLIERSWQQSSYPGQQKPWPWADSWPVAKLGIGHHGFYVLAGAHGTSLAFGPGLISGTSAPGQPGATVIAGHRDTHFSILGQVEIDDVIRLENHKGEFEYQVEELRVVDVRTEPGLRYEQEGTSLLALVTCYPLDSVKPGPLRLVVIGRIRQEPL